MIDWEGKKYYNESEVSKMIQDAKLQLIRKYKERLDELHQCLQPDEDYMFHGPKNTTVKFKDGRSVTVRRMKGEIDSAETALAYILAYSAVGKQEFKRLSKLFKEVK